MTFSEEQIEELAQIISREIYHLTGWKELLPTERCDLRAAARAVAERAVEMAEKARVEA